MREGRRSLECKGNEIIGVREGRRSLECERE